MKATNTIQIQVTSINGSQSTINFEKRQTGGLGLENEHRTKKSKLGERNFKLLKQNRILLDLLYIQRFIGWLKDVHGINLIEISPHALCEIISVLLEQPKAMKTRNGKVSYYYSNKTYLYAHFFDLLFGSFQDLDKDGTMRTLRLLKKQSIEASAKYYKRILVPEEELKGDRNARIILKELRRTSGDSEKIGQALLKLQEKYGSIQEVSQKLGISEDWANYYIQHLNFNSSTKLTHKNKN